MPVGYRQAGVDFDDLFDPDVRGDGPTAAGLRNGGTPLKYAALAYGSKRADVGYRQAGVDVSNLWAAKGTAQYGIPGLDGKGMVAQDNSLTGQTSMSAAVTVSVLNGTWSAQAATSRGSVGTSVPAPTSGTWLPSGQAASAYDVRFVVLTSSGGAEIVNSAPAFVAVSAGVPYALTLRIPTRSAATNEQLSGNFTARLDIRRRSTGQITSATFTGSVGVRGWL